MFFSCENETADVQLSSGQVGFNDASRAKSARMKKGKREEMKYSEQDIPDGDDGVDVTIDNMKQMSLRDKHFGAIQKLARTLKGATDLDTIRNIFRYVQENVEYQSDPPDKELLISPRHVLSKRHPFGDCDDMTMALAALYLASGFAVRFRVIEWKYDEKGQLIPYFTHVYPLVYVPSLKAWIPTDAVIEEGGGFGNEQGVIRRRKDYPITLNDIRMATLARLDDRIGFADSAVGSSSGSSGQPCCGKKKKRPIILNINNSNNNNINAGNTTSTSRVSSPENNSRHVWQNQHNPRSQYQNAPRRNSNYSPRSQYQHTPREYFSPQTGTPRSQSPQAASDTVPGTGASPAVPRNNSLTPQRNSANPDGTPSGTPNRLPLRNESPSAPRPSEQPIQRAPERFNPARDAAPMGFQQVPVSPKPPQERQEQTTAAPQDTPLREAPVEFDARPRQNFAPDTTENAVMRPPPKEFDENVEEIPNVIGTMRPPPQEFDENVEEIPNVTGTMRPPPPEFDENVEEIPNVTGTMRPAPREFDNRDLYALQTMPLRSAPSAFDARPQAQTAPTMYRRPAPPAWA